MNIYIRIIDFKMLENASKEFVFLYTGFTPIQISLFKMKNETSTKDHSVISINNSNNIKILNL